MNKVTTMQAAVLSAAFLVSGFALFPNYAEAARVKLAEKTVTQHGGPETRTRCIGYASGDWPWPMKGGWKTCNEWATDFKQHRIFVELYGPPDMNGSQLTQIKDACLTSAVASGIATGGSADVMAETFGLCVKTTEVLANLFTDVRIEVKHESFW